MIPTIAPTAVLIDRSNILGIQSATIMDYAVVGAPNAWRKRLTRTQRRVTLGRKVTIYPHCVIFEGANLGNDVVMEERCSVGTYSSVGHGSRVIYQSQVNDNVTIGRNSVVAGFVADNCRIGDGCSMFGALVHSYRCRDTRKWSQIEEEGPILGNNVLVAWGAVLVGHVHVGAGARIGVNSTVIGPIRIGEDAVVGPNLVVREDLPKGGRI